MDIIEARLACLKMAFDHGKRDEILLAKAKEYADFISPPVKESSGSGRAKGADEK